MPVPVPGQGESRSDFVSRCMRDEVMKREFPDQKQRVAVCYSQFRRRRGKAPQKKGRGGKPHGEATGGG